ncbi:MAG: thioredoxin TrxC [Alphaproteobacteria bacterium]
MTDHALQLVCPRCGGMNRIPPGRPAAAGRCGHCRSALFDGEPHAATAAAFDRHVGRDGIPVVVDFWAAWCGPCKAMAPAYARVTAECEPAARFLKVDVDAESELAARFAIRSIPTLMLFRDGKPVAQAAGAMDASRLRAWLAAQGVR